VIDERGLGSALFALLPLLPACGTPSHDFEVGVVRRSERIVYGDDGRRELWEHPDDALRAHAAESVVALFDHDDLLMGERDVEVHGSTLREREQVCAEEPFAEQVSAAVCSGVLVAPDVVLTAGHCVWRYGCSELAFAFDYAYPAPPERDLRVEVGDIYRCSRVQALEVTDSDAGTLDYAFVELDRAALDRVSRPLAPRDAVVEGAPVRFVSFPGGVPVKLDTSGAVTLTRWTEGDYFVASTDSSHGSSGGPALDENGFVLGILARGGADYVPTERGCMTTARLDDDGTATEEFTYAEAALRGWCDSGEGPAEHCATIDGETHSVGCNVGVQGSQRSSTHAAAAALVAFVLVVMRLQSVK
jgi:hypothetical protein